MPDKRQPKRDMGFVGHNSPCQSYRYKDIPIPPKCRPERAASFFDDKEFMPPLVVNIEPSNGCNLRCVMCPTHLYPKKAHFLSWNLFEKIVEESLHFQKYFTTNQTAEPYFVFQGAGEPMLHKDLFKMMTYAKKQGLRNISMTTNGSLLSEATINHILTEESSPDFLIFSIDGHTPQLYEKYRNGASFDKVYNNIKALHARRRQLSATKPEIAINTLLTSFFDIDAFLELWGPYVDNIFVSPMLNLAERRQDNELFQDSVQKVSDKFLSCPKIFESISITAEGYITSCQHDFARIHLKGDMNKGDTLHDIWQSEHYYKHRKSHLDFKGSETSCNGCDHMYRIDNEQELFSLREKVKKYFSDNGTNSRS